MSAYGALEARFRRLGLLGGAAAMLHWDWATMMPPGGAEPRAAQLAELALIRHETLTDPSVRDPLLDEAEADSDTLDDWQRANLARMRRRWREAAALPADLVQALSEASSHCEMVWREARPASDFPAFARAFAPLLALVREKAAALGEALGLRALRRADRFIRAGVALRDHRPALRRSRGFPPRISRPRARAAGG